MAPLGRIVSTAAVAVLVMASGAHADAGGSLPTGGHWWVDHYAQSNLDNSKGWSAFVGLHPYGNDTDNSRSWYEFSGQVRPPCSKAPAGATDYVSVSGTHPSVWVTPNDLAGNALITGTETSYYCGKRHFMLDVQIATTASWRTFHYPPSQCPFLTNSTSGCVSMYRDGQTRDGNATIFVGWWWCTAATAGNANECMADSADATYRRGQVSIGKEVVLYQPQPVVGGG